MLKKIVFAGALAAGVVLVATASIVLDVGAYEQGIETASHLNTMYTMPPAFGVQGPMSADAI